MTYFACGRGNGKSAPEPDIAVGDRVARKSNRALMGEVVRIFRATNGKLTAKVKWPDAARPGGAGYIPAHHSSVAVSSLVKVEGESK